MSIAATIIPLPAPVKRLKERKVMFPNIIFVTPPGSEIAVREWQVSSFRGSEAIVTSDELAEAVYAAADKCKRGVMFDLKHDGKDLVCFARCVKGDADNVRRSEATMHFMQTIDIPVYTTASFYLDTGEHWIGYIFVRAKDAPNTTEAFKAYKKDAKAYAAYKKKRDGKHNSVKPIVKNEQKEPKAEKPKGPKAPTMLSDTDKAKLASVVAG